MHVLKAITATGLFLAVASGCAYPQSLSVRQPVGIQHGDTFALLTSAEGGSTAASRDAVVVAALSNHIGTNAVGENTAHSVPRWQVEYSFSARPAKIAMVSSDEKRTQPVGLPEPSYLLDCNRTSYRMTMRIVDANNGAPAYQATAEAQSCKNTPEEHEETFARFVTGLVPAIKVQ